MDDAKIGCKSLALNSSYSEKKLKHSPKQDALNSGRALGIKQNQNSG